MILCLLWVQVLCRLCFVKISSQTIFPDESSCQELFNVLISHLCILFQKIIPEVEWPHSVVLVTGVPHRDWTSLYVPQCLPGCVQSPSVNKQCCTILLPIFLLPHSHNLFVL